MLSRRWTTFDTSFNASGLTDSKSAGADDDEDDGGDSEDHRGNINDEDDDDDEEDEEDEVGDVDDVDAGARAGDDDVAADHIFAVPEDERWSAELSSSMSIIVTSSSSCFGATDAAWWRSNDSCIEAIWEDSTLRRRDQTLAGSSDSRLGGKRLNKMF